MATDKIVEVNESGDVVATLKASGTTKGGTPAIMYNPSFTHNELPTGVTVAQNHFGTESTFVVTVSPNTDASVEGSMYNITFEAARAEGSTYKITKNATLTIKNEMGLFSVDLAWNL